MGIYDREYYRKQGPRYLDAMGISGSACKWLIIANIVVYVLQIVTRNVALPALTYPRMGLVTDLFILDTARTLHGELWRLVTYSFLHTPPPVWQHIFFNLLFLWWFGSDVETIYGTREFTFFYLLAALLGGLAFEGWQLLSNGPALCLGASGAVTAVMVLYACHFPTRTIYVMFLLPVPIWLFVLFQVVQDSFLFAAEAAHTGVKSQTAVVVHLAGAAFAFAYFKMQWRGTNWLPSLREWRWQRSKPRLRIVRPDNEAIEPVAVGAPAASPVDEQLEAKVDAVLEKVARSGQASLTDTEREILLRASQIYKRRRT